MRHILFISVQDQLEVVLDVVLANQRYVLAERHAQRKFLVHSLHSLNGLISDTFSSTSSNLDSWFTHIRRFVLNLPTNHFTFHYNPLLFAMYGIEWIILNSSFQQHIYIIYTLVLLPRQL